MSKPKEEAVPPIKEAKWLNVRVALYPNRIEIAQNIFPFGWKKETILLRNVTSIEKGIGTRLFVITNDKKKHAIPIVGDWNAWQEAIANAL
jgi:hypothetical protein